MQPDEDREVDRRRRSLEIAWFLSVAIASSLACFYGAREVGPTFDENTYFEYGLQCWEVGHHTPLAGWGTMPLPIDVQTLPLAWAKFIQGVDPRADFIGYLPSSRTMTLVFWWWLLGAGYLAARARGGAAAGCTAVGLLAAEPVLLGHAALATTDIASAATLVTVLVVFQRSYDRDAPTRKRRLVAGVAVAIALLTKATALIFAPICLFAVELERLWQSGWRPRFERAAWKMLAPAVREVGAVFGVGLLFVAVLFPRTLYALFFQILHNARGHGPIYLLGRTEEFGFWYYFFVAFVAKCTLSLLALLATGAIIGRRSLVNAPLLAATAILLLSPGYRVQIGVRFLFPMITLFVAGAATALFADRPKNFASATRAAPRRRGVIAAFAILAVAWSATEAYRVWPNGICFTNQLFGGTDRGYLALCESNYDWGQGYDELDAWHHEQGRPPIYVWVFGPDPRWLNGPMQPIGGHEYPDTASFLAASRGRYLAVSVSNLYAYHAHTAAGKYLLGHEPTARTQTFLIYDFRDSEPRTASDAGPPVFRRR